MDPSNCVGLYHWARDLGAVDLADSALRYLCQHFAQVGLSKPNIFSIGDIETDLASKIKCIFCFVMKNNVYPELLRELFGLFVCSLFFFVVFF